MCWKEKQNGSSQCTSLDEQLVIDMIWYEYHNHIEGTIMDKQQSIQSGSGKQHAVVIGASMAGLLAARALSDHFEQVTIIERDQLTDDTEPRRGVPQGRHAHALLAGGASVLGELFPDLFPALARETPGGPPPPAGSNSRTKSATPSSPSVPPCSPAPRRMTRPRARYSSSR